MSVVKHLILAFVLGLIAFQTRASDASQMKIEDVVLKRTSDSTSQLIIKLNGQLLENPELTIRDQMIQVAVPNSYVWPKVERKVTVQKNNDTTVMAYQFEKDVVRVRALLPYSLTGKEDRVNVVMRGDHVELNFPSPAAPAKQAKAPAPVAAPTPKVLAETVTEEAKKADHSQYDESFLANLVKENDFEQTPTQVVEDQVQVSMAAQERAPEKFSVTNYIVKFVAFLGLVLVLFYAVMALMRKGVLKKGRLGFLNSTKVVEVLNTTHLAPKRSLILVRAHNQVFLVGSSEKGLELISEVKDTTGLLKEGEREISGSNFDSTLGQAQTYTKDFKLKEELNSSADEGLAGLLNEKPVKDSVKLSEQIKNKVKGLKALQ